MRGNTIDHGQCITEETLTDYLEGVLGPAVKAASEAHLIACDACRSRLTFFMRLLSEDVSEEEVTTLQVIEDKWNDKGFRDRPVRRTGTLNGWFLALAALSNSETLAKDFISFSSSRSMFTRLPSITAISLRRFAR